MARSRNRQAYPGRLLMEFPWRGSEVVGEFGKKVGGETYHCQIRFVEESLTFVGLVKESIEIRVEGANVREVKAGLVEKLRKLGMTTIVDFVWVRVEPSSVLDSDNHGFAVQRLQVGKTEFAEDTVHRLMTFDGVWGSWRAGEPQAAFKKRNDAESIGFLIPLGSEGKAKVLIARIRGSLQKLRTHVRRELVRAFRDWEHFTAVDIDTIVATFRSKRG